MGGLVALVSAAGSPGVTTTALGLAAMWPRRALLVEADPSGGSAMAAGFFRGASAAAGTVVDLAWAHREGRLAETVDAVAVPIDGSLARLVPGVRSHVQAYSAAAVWAPLVEVLRGRGEDVLVDAGRLGAAHAPAPLLAAADLTVLVVRSDLVAVATARSWAEELAAGPGRVAVLVVGDGRPYPAAEVAAVLGLPLIARVAWEPAVAAMFSAGAQPPRRPDRSPLLRSLTAAALAISDDLPASPSDALHASSRPESEQWTPLAEVAR